MPRTIALFSVGAPDPTQGGSGIFNYLVCRELLARGYGVRAWFRSAEWFIRDHVDRRFLEQLERDGVEVNLVEHPVTDTRKLGLDFMLAHHSYASSHATVQAAREELERCDGVISLELGWALALADLSVPKICILGDPLERRMAADLAGAPWNRTTLRRRVQLLSLRGVYRKLRPWLDRFDGRDAVLGHFAPQHARELRDHGYRCRHFRWFAPGPAEVRREPRRDGPLEVLHVGALQSTSSRKMFEYWRDELLPELARQRFPLRIAFAGRTGGRQPLVSQWPSIELVFEEHVDDLEPLFARSALFLSPMQWPVGVRTRILTALAHGLPVVADTSARAAMPELDDGREIVFAQSSRAVAEAVARVRDDKAWSTELSRKGRAAWERFYDPATNVPALVNALAAPAR